MKRMQRTTAAAVFAALGLASSAALAAPCAGFTDVDTSNQFCANIEWIKNRAVTLGCATGLYCPVDFVTREQMAAFMNRLGNALTPVVLTQTLATGPVDLDIPDTNPAAHLCQTGPYVVESAPTNFPRRAIIYAQYTGRAAGAVEIFGTTSMSVNGGPFVRTAPLGIGMRSSTHSAVWTNVTQTASVDLTPGNSYTFAFLIQRAVEDAGTSDLSSGRCNMTVMIESRTGTTSPFDAAAAGPLDNQ